MFTVIDCIRNQHDLRLVLLAAVICGLASVVAFKLDDRRQTSQGRAKTLWMVMTGVVAGGGVWATHFIAMLAYAPTMPMNYHLTGTLVSLAIGMFGMGGGFVLASAKPTQLFAAAGGALAGLSIAVMHFVGVTATATALQIRWNADLVAASIILGVTLGAAALLIARSKGRPRLVGAPILLALAICGMHFTAMGAVTLIPDLTLDQTAEIINRTEMATMTGAIAGLIMMAAIILITVETHSRHVAIRSLQNVFHGIPAGLAMFDSNERLVLWNQAYATLVQSYGAEPKRGVTRKDMITKVTEGGGFDGLNGRDSDANAIYMQARRNAGPFEWEAPDGRWLHVEHCAIEGGDNIAVLTDITALKASTLAMAEARDRAEAANRSKSDFLANMSHEIRTPLNGVLGMVQVMAADPLSDEQRGRLGVIKQSGATLLAILNDLLDLSKIEAGRLEITPVEFDLEALAQTSCAAFEGSAAAKDLQIICEVAHDCTGVWRGDALRIRQILSNLIGNAVKFTETGSVRLIIERQNQTVAFSVKDTGIGVDAAQIHRLFDKFSQEDATTTRRYGGTGLGLAICRELATLMGGEITVESVKGWGSSFRMTLPLEAVAKPAKARPAETVSTPVAMERLRILAAEDNPTNQLVLTALLRPLDVDLTMVSNGAEAVAAFRDHNFDLVLMDVQMPVMNGVDACLAIRRMEAESGVIRTPMIALTANVMPHQVQDYLNAGMDGAIAKPIEVEKLYAALDQALSNAPEPLSAVA